MSTRLVYATTSRLRPLPFFVSIFLNGLCAVLGSDIDINLGECGVGVIVCLHARIEGASLRWG
jgi:hypothetical protein